MRTGTVLVLLGVLLLGSLSPVSVVARSQGRSSITSGTAAQKLSSTPTFSDENNSSVSTPVDSDDDGLSDARETEHGTNPQNPDTDGDGLTDGTKSTVRTPRRLLLILTMTDSVMARKSNAG